MKKILTLLLTCAMILALFVGCGGTATVEEEAGKPAASSGSSATEAAVTAVDGGDEEEGFTRFEDLQEITVTIQVWADWEGRKEVFEEINKISEEQLNVHINFYPLLSSEFRTQLPLMLAAGEVVDLTMIPWNFADMTGQNMLLPLNDYLEEYAPFISEKCADYLPANTLDGKILGVPTLRMYNTSQYLLFRQDVLEYLGLYDEAMAIDSWSSLEALLLKVKDAQPDLPEELQTPVIFGQQNGTGSVVTQNGLQWVADKWEDDRVSDYLGCEYLWVDPETNQIECNYTNDAAKAHYDRMYKWYHEGLISKDASTFSEYADTCAANGLYFCYPSNAEYGAGFAKSNNTGRPLCAIIMKNIGLTTSYVSCFAWGLPATCENPEAAVAVMNLLFENVDVANLLVWGIRGRDYELDENGCAYRLEGHTYEALEYFQGNQFNAYPPVQPEGSAYRQNQWNDNVSGYISPFFGLVIDNTEIANELTAVKAVYDKYLPTLGSGEVAADGVIEQFAKDMDAAGMAKIISFYQEAVDEWLAK